MSGDTVVSLQGEKEWQGMTIKGGSTMNSFLREFFHEFMIAARETPRIYFAPFIGAWRGIRAEYGGIERQRRTTK